MAKHSFRDCEPMKREEGPDQTFLNSRDLKHLGLSFKG